jgi:hypothetical protein
MSLKIARSTILFTAQGGTPIFFSDSFDDISGTANLMTTGTSPAIPTTLIGQKPLLLLPGQLYLRFQR